MKVTIKEQEITLKYSMRSLFLYEQKSGESFSPRNLEQYCLYFYCVVMSSNRDLDLTFDDFIDFLDEDPSKITEFAEWLSNVMMKNDFLSGAAQSQEKEKGKGNKKK